MKCGYWYHCKEFIDDSDIPADPALELYNPPPPHPPISGGCPISEYLQKLGLRLKRECLDACVDGLRQSVPGFQNLHVEAKAYLCFEQFLVSDMNRSGGGVLPENVAYLHLVHLPGPYVLQVDEMANMCKPLEERYQEVPAGHERSLKLSMTDGVQRVYAAELQSIPALEVLAPAGLKVVIHDVLIIRGLLMLGPECIEVLGGFVEELDAARQRLVDEANKPPSFNRTRNGVVPPLATRLALAAWPHSGVHTAGDTHSSTMDGEIHMSGTRLGQGSNCLALTPDNSKYSEYFEDIGYFSNPNEVLSLNFIYSLPKQKPPIDEAAAMPMSSMAYPIQRRLPIAQVQKAWNALSNLRVQNQATPSTVNNSDSRVLGASVGNNNVLTSHSKDCARVLVNDMDVDDEDDDILEARHALSSLQISQATAFRTDPMIFDSKVPQNEQGGSER